MSVLAFTLAAHIAAGTVTADMVPMFGVVLVALSAPVLLGTRLYSVGRALLASGLPPFALAPLK